jgi:hypothetical protein
MKGEPTDDDSAFLANAMPVFENRLYNAECKPFVQSSLKIFLVM